MREHIKDLYLLMMYLLAVVCIIFLVVTGVEAIWVTLFFTVCWLLSFSIRNLLLYNTDSYRKWAFATYLMEIGLMFWLGQKGAGGAVRLLLCITLADCCIIWGMGYGVACQLLILLSICLQQVFPAQMTARGMLLTVFKEIPLLFVVTLVSYLVGRVFKSSVLLENSMKDVQEREAKLSVAYHQLSQAYKRLEEMATLKERNRIAREIHDTVGHTLTTVIIEMEAGKLLAEKEPLHSKKKYEMAHQQAVKALNEMRKSVRMLREEEYAKDLKQAVEEVLDETSRHADVTVRYTVELPEGVKTQHDDLLVRALKEGISNGIRHGKGTAFLFKLYSKEEKLHFLLQDNGIGCDKVIYGFGLDSMKRGVEQVGGSIVFSTALGEGFDIEIVLPVKKRGA